MEQELRDKEKQLALPFGEKDAPIIDAEFLALPEDAPPALASLPENTGDSPILTRMLTEAGLSQRDARKIARLQWDYVDADARPEYTADTSFERYVREKIDLLQRQDETPRSRTGFLLKAIRENWVNPDFAEREKKSTEWKAIVEKKRQREQLEQEKARLNGAYSDACDAIYAAILEERPDALNEMIQAAIADNPILRKHCKGDTPEAQYAESMFISTAVQKLMEHRFFPERFQAVNDEYQPRLDALEQKIAALG
jgi:hypothetical protein